MASVRPASLRNHLLLLLQISWHIALSVAVSNTNRQVSRGCLLPCWQLESEAIAYTKCLSFIIELSE